MAKDNSFDIVSEVNLSEVENAVNQASKEIETRFDFKNSASDIKLDEDKLTLVSDDDFKLKNVIDILENKLVKRGISLKAIQYGKVEPAAKDTVRQTATLKQGLTKEEASKVVKIIKESKIKVQAQIQGDAVRVTGKVRDDLQAVIKLLKEQDLDFEVQFNNYR
ncbi:MAG TPA: YajQ family cyclic di-GMP-binding protein [Bacillota bacterium]|nr:YajQ family cyclic di-GMP-binding protein [Bacillota bacterium]